MGDEALQFVDVVGDAGHQFPGGGALEEREGQTLQIVVDAHAQIEEKALAQRVAQILVAELGQPQEGIDADHNHHGDDQATHVAGADYLVDDLALEERRQEAQAGLEQQQDAGGGEWLPVGAKTGE